MRSYKLSVLLCLLLVCGNSLRAEVTLPYFFSDNMVLQQQSAAAVWGWAKPGSQVTVTASWSKKKFTAKADSEGKWKLKVATPKAGGPYELTISDGTPITIKNILIGEVWLCSGQSNMEMPMKGYNNQPITGSEEAIAYSANDQIRLFTVPRSVKLTPLDTCKHNTWKAAAPEAVSNFSATGYFFGRQLQQQLKVPVGLVNISYGGSPAEAFMHAAALGAFPEIHVPSPTDTGKFNNKTPTTLYNGMLHPFIGYTIKGCIWYQGESNYDRPDQYEKLFPAMVKSWRDEFGQGDFPFYFAQIAPFNYAQLPDAKLNSANLRDAQRKAVQAIPNSGMVVLMDIGEAKNIHPAGKETGSKRLAGMALAKTYKLEEAACCSPDYASVRIANDTAIVTFKDAANGLSSFNKTLQHFEIAGNDKKFYPAKAVISGSTVKVFAAEVTAPVAVRYAFKDFVEGDLFSRDGLPVSSFRTDNW